MSSFKTFLHRIKTSRNLNSVNELYLHFGGEKELGIGLRTFQLMESGKSLPTAQVLVTLYKKLPITERKPLITCFLTSLIEAESKGIAKEVQEFLERNLFPEPEASKRSVFEDLKHVTYSEEQLRFLMENPDAARLHHSLFLLDNIQKKKCRLRKEKLDKMVELELIKVKGDEILPFQSFWKLPSSEDSSSREVSIATDYILSHLPMYIKKEGSPNQELSYTFQLVSEEQARTIIDQQKGMKKWIQHQATRNAGPGIRPCLYISLVTVLDEKDLKP